MVLEERGRQRKMQRNRSAAERSKEERSPTPATCHLHAGLQAWGRATTRRSGNPRENINDDVTATVAPVKKRRSTLKSLKMACDIKLVRMIERAVLKQPCVAPAYLSMTAQSKPPKAVMKITQTTRKS